MHFSWKDEDNSDLLTDLSALAQGGVVSFELRLDYGSRDTTFSPLTWKWSQKTSVSDEEFTFDLGFLSKYFTHCPNSFLLPVQILNGYA